MFNRKSCLTFIILSVLGVIINFGPAHADEIMESINEAIEYYKEKDYLEAKNSLQYAIQLIGQLRSQGLQGFLPEPLKGWEAEEGQTKNVGASMFGGMTGATREYRKGKGYIKIEIMGDSPMMQGIMGMFANPAFATADGGKLRKIKRQKAVVKYNKSNLSGEITIVVANKYVVKVEGNSISEQELIDYASAINFKGLKKF